MDGADPLIKNGANFVGLLSLPSQRQSHRAIFSSPNAETPFNSLELKGALGCKSLTMTYFHTGIRTIIGAKSFHFPVRDGKEWGQLAMVIRHNLVLGS